MSMSTHVVGIRPLNERWNQMKAIWDACTTARVPFPKEVTDFFGDTVPDPAGVVVKLPSGCLIPYHQTASEGFEVDLTSLPKDVTRLRFTNSW